jgi:hypothetical protein
MSSENTTIPLVDASVIAAPSSPNSSVSDPSTVLLGHTWLLTDNSPGYWTASFSFPFTPVRIRLLNSDVVNTGTKSFSLTPLASSSLANLTYDDPATNLGISTCSSRCPLIQGIPGQPVYQDFHFVNLITMNSFRIDISDWYGSQGGLGGLQLFGDFSQPSATNSIQSATSSSTSRTSPLISRTSTSIPTGSTSSATASPTSKGVGLSGGAIAGIVISIVGVFLIAMGVLVFWRRKRSGSTLRPDEKFVPLGGRHEVDAKGVSQTKYRAELHGQVVSELDVVADRHELEAKRTVHEVAGD